jgi:hypothetical protein
MTQREKTLAAVVGAAIVLGVGYKAVDTLLIGRHAEAKEHLAKLKTEERRLQGIIGSRDNLARRWLAYTGRTFSFERTEARGRLGKDLKELAKRHGFADAVFGTHGGTKIGRRTDISTVAHRIAIQGRFPDVTAFLRDVYEKPYLGQIIKLTITPLGAKGSRGTVKLECTIESPLLPVVDPKEIPHVRGAKPLDPEPEESPGPARGDVHRGEFYDILAVRNIFRPYLPPPQNVVMIDNLDWKTIALKIKFLWDDAVNEQLVETVAGKSNLPVKGKGDIVTISGTYADGVTFGPKRLRFDGKKDWTYAVPAHTPPPPPTVVDLAIDNRHEEAVHLEVVVTTKDGKKTTEPIMIFESGISDVRVFEKVQSVKVTAQYVSGERTSVRTFSPMQGKQTYVVRAELPEEIVEVPTAPASAGDQPPDTRFTVTALWRYLDAKDGRAVQEMIATATNARRTIRIGEPGAVDGGTLVAVVPGLGGIVKMPDTGNYYIYPWKRKYTDRVILDAREDSDLPAAIDAWTRR